MRNKILLLLVFLVQHISSYSQLKVLGSNGYVGINQNTPLYRLDINGSTRFIGNGSADYIMDPMNSTSPSFYPSANNFGLIGKSTNWFNHSYINTMDCSILTAAGSGGTYILDPTTGTGPAFYPSSNNFGLIGKSTNWFNHSYINTMDCSILTAAGSGGTYILDPTTSTGPAFYPSVSNFGMIGKSSNWFNHAYITDISYQNLYSVSDRRMKENIVVLNNSLDKIKKVKTYTYNYKAEYDKEKTADKKNHIARNYYGVIAQEFMTVFPELVTGSDSTMYAVNYVGLIPVLLESIKEQQAVIETLQYQLTQLNSKNNKLSQSDNYKADTIASLMQNSPNPFNQSTNISYYIPHNSTSAYIYIYNMVGSQLKNYTITTKGNGSTIITASEYSPGLYLYTLIVDGKEVETKKMILTN